MRLHKLVFILLLNILFISNICHAQVVQEWVRQYSSYSNGWNIPYAISTDSYGNIYVTGYSSDNSHVNHYTTIKYNSMGTMQWNRIDTLYYGTSCFNALDEMGNLYITGTCTVNNGIAVVTIKYSPEGNILWRVVFRGEGNNLDEAFDLKVDQSGNIFICGINSPVMNAPYRYLTLKYNPDGILQWSKYYNGTGNGSNMAWSIEIDRNGNSYVTGTTYNLNTFDDYTTIKYSLNGTQMWVCNYSGLQSSEDQSRAITLDSSLNVYVTGFSGGNALPYRCTTLKYNNEGLQQWIARYDSSIYCQPRKISVDRNGNIVIAGDFGTIKYSTYGQLMWSNQECPLYDLDIDRNCNVYACGVKNIDTLLYLYTAKYSAVGTKIWEQIYLDKNYFNFKTSIRLDTSCNVYVTGSTYETPSYHSSTEFTTIKYSQIIGIKPISNKEPDKFSLFQNYPNPFNPSTKIKFALPSNVKREMSNVRLIVYDILGREVATLVNQQLKPGTYEVEFDGTNYPSGMYFYKLITESFSQTKRMVLLK